MKNKVLQIIAVIACILLVIDSFRITRLKNEINGLHLYINNQMNEVNRNIELVYSNIQNMLEKESNLLAVSEWEYGDINVEKRTASVYFKFVPKEYNPDITKLTITCNDKDYDLRYENNQYIGNIELPLFSRNEINKVDMNDNGTIRTQKLNWNIEPRYEALPIFYSYLGGSWRGEQGSNEYTWLPQCSVIINIEGKKDYQIKSVELVEIIDGKEITRIPIDISTEGQKAYAESIRKSHQPTPEFAEEMATEVGGTFNRDLHYIYYLGNEHRIKNGSSLELYVDVVDGNNLCYRSFVDCIAVKADGLLDDDFMCKMAAYSSAEPVIIFDDKGNKIFELDKTLFK